MKVKLAPLQRRAAKLMAGFFALMLLFTLVSRAAQGMTLAAVDADTVKTGTITQRTELTGVIRPLEDLEVFLPGDLYITDVAAQPGQKVAAGEVLLTLDLEDLEAKLEEQRNALVIAETRLDMIENSAGTDDTAVVNAQLNLELAQDDYERLAEKLDRSAARAQEDYAAAQAEAEEAQEAYEAAKVKAKAEMTEAAKVKMEAAKKAYDEAKTAAEDAIDNAKYSYEKTKAEAEKKLADAITAAQTALESAKSAGEESVAAAQYNYDSVVARPGTGLEIQRSYELLEGAKEKAAAQVAAAETALSQAEKAVLPDEVDRAYDNWQTTKSRQNAKVSEAQSGYYEAVEDYDDAKAGVDLEEQQGVVAAENALKNAEKALGNAKRALEDSGQSVDDQLLGAARSVAAAQRSLEQAQRDAGEKERTGENAQSQALIDTLNQRALIAAAEKTIAALEEIIAGEGQLTAPVDGTVQSIAAAGKTQERVAVAVLSRNDMGFQFEAKLDSYSAEGLAPGDSGNFSYKADGASQRTKATVTEIGAADEDGNCLILAALPQGSYPAGANGSLTITRSGERQNTCLPVSALRSDNDGEFVLVLQEKKTVLGLEYTAKRVDVTVLDRDSSLVSVQSALGREALVITAANKPVSEGERVRLNEE